MSKVSTSDIDDIFGIPRDGSNIVDDDDGDVYNSGKTETQKVAFEEKAKELAEEVTQKIEAKTEPKVEKSTTEKKVDKPKSEKKEDVETSLKSVIPTTKSFDDLFEDDEKKTPEPPKAEPVKPAIVEESKPVEPVVVEPVVEAKVPKAESVGVMDPKGQVETDDASTKANEPQRQPSVPLNTTNKSRKHVWKLDCPSAKYNYFYKEKRDALENMLLVGGELDFDKIFAELEGASVDVSVGETFVPDLICKKLEEVQRFRDRIKQLQLQVNRQYFHWERAMELFDGLLRRTEYDKFKQDGVMYEHMYDMEMYHSDLKSLHRSIDTVSRTLDGAFECLSRQVTITMPMKEVSDRYSNGPRAMTPQLSKFDGLKTHANGGGSKPTVATKEGPKGLEPEVGW
jgi:hypothetical protein